MASRYSSPCCFSWRFCSHSLKRLGVHQLLVPLAHQRIEVVGRVFLPELPQHERLVPRLDAHHLPLVEVHRVSRQQLFEAVDARDLPCRAKLRRRRRRLGILLYRGNRSSGGNSSSRAFGLGSWGRGRRFELGFGLVLDSGRPSAALRGRLGFGLGGNSRWLRRRCRRLHIDGWGRRLRRGCSRLPLELGRRRVHLLAGIYWSRWFEELTRPGRCRS